MRRRNETEYPSGQKGFTLVETMVALVVLSVGLLGVAKLVVGSVHANDSGYMRGQATQLAYEILDQMRANRPGAASYAGPGVFTDCSATACAPAVLAGLDVYNWKQRLSQTLPGGTGTVAVAAGVGGATAIIRVSWDDSEAQWAFGTSPSVIPAPMVVVLESVL